MNAELPNGINAGRMTQQWTMWCAVCPRWDTACGSKTSAVRAMQSDGWVKRVGFWQCPKCAAISKQAQQPKKSKQHKSGETGFAELAAAIMGKQPPPKKMSSEEHAEQSRKNSEAIQSTDLH